MNHQKSTGIVRIEKPGPPEVLKYETVDLPDVKVNEVLINQKAIGLNFLDIMFRDGRFSMDAYPATLGLEAAGVIEAIGTGVTDFAIGDRVAYYGTSGAYTEFKIINSEDIFKLFDDISFDQAAATMIKGLTAHMLIKESYQVKAGDFVLVQAATGGVGSLLSAWARSLGAKVIGTVGSPGKKQLAASRGLDYVIDLQNEDLSERVASITNGKRVDVVYDSIGRETFNQFVKVVRKGGTIVSFGAATGWPEPDRHMMEERGVRYVQGILNNYAGYQNKKSDAVIEVLEKVSEGILQVEPTIYSLSDAALAHADLESRKTTGSIILKS
ncbi:quinone oxidoreductase family protein [Pedobacter fastidiosus]|uniref:Quinone oxidoreductase n=1 Tax=Pedobacter fastidiosus TaxID=2765361 RepID=A0ABR7KXZ5_9SPHI|nr:quinone oxidoreductase [Pedobacter fastidiosus]MBC6112995.1 quinone oxidoreductase [Pedobacter fastidiosus]